MKKQISFKQKFSNFVKYVIKTPIKQKWADVCIFYHIDDKMDTARRNRAEAESMIYKGALAYDLDVPACITEIFRCQADRATSVTAFPVDTIQCDHFKELEKCPMADCLCFSNKNKFTKIAQKHEKLKHDRKYFWAGKFAQVARAK